MVEKATEGTAEERLEEEAEKGGSGNMGGWGRSEAEARNTEEGRLREERGGGGGGKGQGLLSETGGMVGSVQKVY